MIIHSWYTFATEIVAYSNPQNKYIIGIVKEDTAHKLEKYTRELGFLLLPKHVTRHVPEIFKKSLFNEYAKSLELVQEIDKADGYTEREHKCDYFAIVHKVYYVDYKNSKDKNFIKLISPFYPWTFDHVNEYLEGKDPEIPENIGKGGILILKLYYLNSAINIFFKQAHRDSSQIKKHELGIGIDSFKNLEPIIPENEFSEITALIEVIYNYSRKVK